MASVIDRWHKTLAREGEQVCSEHGKAPTAQHGKGDRWQARHRPVPGGKQLTRTEARKVDAERWLAEQTASVVTGQFVDPKAGKITFRAYFDQWAARQVWAPNTRRDQTRTAHATTFADLPLGAILRSHVEQWVKAMETADRGKDKRGKVKPRGLAPGTIATRVGNVRSVFRAAVRDKVIHADPSEGVRLPRKRRAEAAMRLPTTDQVRALLDTVEPSYRAFVALAAFAGLRLGEAAALKVSDVDFLGRTLAVERQVQRVNGGKVDIRLPKAGSERTVYLADELVTMLSEHVREHRPGDNLDRWLFEGQNGHPPHQNTVGYYWRRARKAAGCPGVRLHDLRHFFASGLIAAGCDVVTVQRALGHSSATITLKTYAHLWPTAEDRTRRAAADMLAATLHGAAEERVRNGGAK